MKKFGRFTYTHTLYSCYVGYVTQAIINNLSPLLFVVFNRDLGISLEKISLIISVNFGVQIAVDLIGAKYVDRIGYRASGIIAHALSVIGLAFLGLLPLVVPPYAAILTATVVLATGGGLIEVIISPIVEALPREKKSATMSVLHSFYCWGHVAVVLLSTLYFNVAGLELWRWLPLLWAVIPAVNIFMFCKVPFAKLVDEEKKLPVKRLLAKRAFWILFVMMICAGAAEQAVSQWSSLFAELGLRISKTTGDLLGPCCFAFCMGLARVLFGLKADKLNLKTALLVSSGGCFAAYMLTVFSPIPVLSLTGCALCGFFAGILWPASFSLSSSTIPEGGTPMFGLLSLGGDIGCSLGPAIVGLISDKTADTALPSAFGSSPEEASLKLGLLAASSVCVVMIVFILMLKRLSSENPSFPDINSKI